MCVKRKKDEKIKFLKVLLMLIFVLIKVILSLDLTTAGFSLDTEYTRQRVTHGFQFCIAFRLDWLPCMTEEAGYFTI